MNTLKLNFLDQSSVLSGFFVARCQLTYAFCAILFFLWAGPTWPALAAQAHGSQLIHLAQIAGQIVGSDQQFCSHPAALKPLVAC